MQNNLILVPATGHSPLFDRPIGSLKFSGDALRALLGEPRTFRNGTGCLFHEWQVIVDGCRYRIRGVERIAGFTEEHYWSDVRGWKVDGEGEGEGTIWDQEVDEVRPLSEALWAALRLDVHQSRYGGGRHRTSTV